jgi:hypothetical protein
MVRKTRPGKTRLLELVNATTPMEGDFPLVHTSDAYRFADILSEKALLPVQCDVFGEPVVYAFLGRPAYRTRQQTNDRLHFDLPIVVIVKPDSALPTPARVFPFDTGAFEKGLYKRYFHKDTEVLDFEIGNSKDQAAKFIAMLYGNFREYFIGETGKNVDIPYGSFEAEGLHELARAPADPTVDGIGSADERSSAVEFQFVDKIELQGNTLAVIVPQQYLDRDEVLSQIEALSPKHIETYEVIAKSGAREIAGSIYQITRQIYIKEGYLP